MVVSLRPAVQRIPLIRARLNASPIARAKWIFRFLEGTVSSSRVSLFKLSKKPRNSIRRRKENEWIRPTRSNFHFSRRNLKKQSGFPSRQSASVHRNTGRCNKSKCRESSRSRPFALIHPEAGRGGRAASCLFSSSGATFSLVVNSRAAGRCLSSQRLAASRGEEGATVTPRRLDSSSKT